MLILMDDGEVIDTNDASVESFKEETFFNGYTNVGKFSFALLENSRMTLFKANGCYYLIQATLDSRVRCAKKIGAEAAAKWLLNNNHHNLPADLQQITENNMRRISTLQI